MCIYMKSTHIYQSDVIITICHGVSGGFCGTYVKTKVKKANYNLNYLL